MKLKELVILLSRYGDMDSEAIFEVLVDGISYGRAFTIEGIQQIPGKTVLQGEEK